MPQAALPGSPRAGRGEALRPLGASVLECKLALSLNLQPMTRGVEEYGRPPVKQDLSPGVPKS